MTEFTPLTRLQEAAAGLRKAMDWCGHHEIPVGIVEGDVLRHDTRIALKHGLEFFIVDFWGEPRTKPLEVEELLQIHLCSVGTKHAFWKILSDTFVCFVPTQ